ncbi:uncharacterized protein BKA55DRAFT_710035 [Fusarium redolens]|uniref:Uncharacterized protein n=1 Tax=Fusarium redolens TaxID=48865 RepID=A0A9P9G9W3_FUSRE|nr:uncharacterized protein BKA55DRAFT_710035 [Fusarium redolens]KAH7233934.1 hypothetical protein BKA55DRAFT_710035 [Fusarium redolens]
MDYDWSRQKGVFVHPHPSTTQPFEPSGSVPLPHSISVANLSAPPSQDTAQTVPLTHLSSSALPTENIPFYDVVPEPTLNSCPWGYPSCPGRSWCPVSHPLQYSTNYSSIDHSISDTNLFTSTQSTFYQQSIQPNPPISANIYMYENTLTCLLPSERFILEERLKNRSWDDILKEHNQRWTPVNHQTALMNRLKKLREKYDVINQILPSRSGASKRSGHNTCSVKMPCAACGLQNY